MKFANRLAAGVMLLALGWSAGARAQEALPGLSAMMPASDAEVGAVKWAGFYFTPYFGYEQLKLNGTGKIGLKDPKGWRLGGEAGYDWQFDRLVLGVAAEGYATWYKGSSTSYTPGTQSSLSDYGTLRGRIGYTFGRFLVYGTGGFAAGDLNVKSSALGLSDSHILTGWTAGGGVDWAWQQNMLLRVELAHIALGETTFQSLPAGRQALGADLDLFKVTFIKHF